MEYFLESFGDVKVGSVVILICSLAFFLKCYQRIKEYFSKKTIEERERDEHLKRMFEQVEQYPKWRNQSIEARDKIDKYMGKLDKKLDKLQESNDERMTLTWRYRILRFDDEIRHDEKHTKEHFDQILEDITNYEQHCRTHPNFENNKAVLAIENIKKVYQKCTEEGTFL